MFNRCLLLFMILLYSELSLAGGGLEIYLVRHAETVANASGENDKSNSGLFTKAGLAQVDALGRELLYLNIDDILVSPTDRTLKTIHPYLEKSKKVGIVWPELTECCWQEPKDGEVGSLLQSGALKLPSEIADEFTFRDANAQLKYVNRSYADGVAQVNQAVDLLKANYFGTGKTILIVTHYHAGELLLGKLLGVAKDRLPGLENAKLAHLRQNRDGRFTLLKINGMPY